MVNVLYIAMYGQQSPASVKQSEGFRLGNTYLLHAFGPEPASPFQNAAGCFKRHLSEKRFPPAAAGDGHRALIQNLEIKKKVSVLYEQSVCGMC